MATLYWHEPDAQGFGGRVIIEGEGVIPSPELKALIGDADGLRGGPSDNRGTYVPITPEHSAELRKAAEDAAAG